MRVLLRFSYDGTNYRGWQYQPDLPTVQGAVENALERLCGRGVGLTGAGRTDAGVHALSMPAHLDVSPEEFGRIRKGLNALLPPDIFCVSAREVHMDFNARFSAVSRSYRYSISRERNPFTRLHEYQKGIMDLNVPAMEQAASLSLGRHSWRGFAKEGSGNATWIMDVEHAGVRTTSTGWEFFIKANRFLRGVVRIWSGTLLRIGTGALPAGTVSRILSSQARETAGPSLPARGLTLLNVEYEDEV